MSDLYKRIHDLCVENHTNITEMCRTSGSPRGSLTDLKMGRTKTLDTTTLSKIAKHFNVSVDFLLGAEETKKAPTSNKADERIRLTQEEADLIAEYRKLTEARKEAIRLSLRAYQDSE